MHLPALRTSVALGAAALAVLGTGVAVHDQGGPPEAAAPRPGTTVTGLPASGVLHPGGTVTGVLRVANARRTPVQVSDVELAAPTSDACSTPGVSLAPTLPPTPESPLDVPAGGSATLEWTAYMDGDGEHACQGATLTSQVLLDGEPAGTITLAAGTLTQPPAPAGGPTTSTRAAVQWSASTAADPGWVVERAVAGTDDWQPACGSSPARPVRALSCTDTGLAAATSYAYRVTLRTGHWHMTSRPSAPVRTQVRPSA